MMIGSKRGLLKGRAVFIGTNGVPILGTNLAVDFRTNFALLRGVQVRVESLFTFSRPAPQWVQHSSGLWTMLANDVFPRTGLGATLDAQATNPVLWCRDLTNAVWTKTTMTAALDQVGIDGVANSASSLVATAANATVLQPITLASSYRNGYAFVKRLAGSGMVQMTMNGGTTWTDITASLTNAWTQISLPKATLANPSVGFRIAASGDSIAVDFVQNQDGIGNSSPIYTQGAAVLRAPNSCTLSPRALSAAMASQSCGASVSAIDTYSQISRVWSTTSAAPELRLNSVTVTMQSTASAGSTTATNSLARNGTRQRISSSFGPSGSSARANGSAIATDATPMTAMAGDIFVANRAALDRPIPGALEQLVFHPQFGACDALAA